MLARRGPQTLPRPRPRSPAFGCAIDPRGTSVGVPTQPSACAVPGPAARLASCDTPAYIAAALSSALPTTLPLPRRRLALALLCCAALLPCCPLPAARCPLPTARRGDGCPPSSPKLGRCDRPVHELLFQTHGRSRPDGELHAAHLNHSGTKVPRRAHPLQQVSPSTASPPQPALSTCPRPPISRPPPHFLRPPTPIAPAHRNPAAALALGFLSANT